MASPSAFATFTIIYHLFLSVPRICAEDVTTTIDDSDPSIQHITGKWVQFKGAEYYNGTETLTREAGATTLYTFNGTSIAVFGTQCDPAGGNTTVSTYTLDHFGPSKFTVPPGVICNQNFVNFYTSPPLQNGQHNLVITNLNNNAWFFLDYLMVTAPRADVSPANSTSTLSPTSTPSATPSADSTSQSSKSSTISIGAIVGIAVGIAVLLAFIVIAALWWRRRHRPSYSHKPNEEVMLETEVLPPAVLTPYLVSESSNPTTIQNSMNQGLSSKGYSGYPHGVVMLSTNHSSSTAASSSVLSPSHSEPQAEIFQVQDSAVESEDPSQRYSATATIPPPYMK